MRFVAASRSRNCCSLTQRRRRTSSARMSAMWAAGPPKPMTPSVRNTRATSPSMARPMIQSAPVLPLPSEIVAVFVAKTARTFCYGFLGIVLPVYLGELGVSPAGIGLAITLTLAGSAVLTWAIRRPAERLGPRAPLLMLVVLSAASALLLLASTWPPLVVLAAILGNVAVGTGETGPFLAIE